MKNSNISANANIILRLKKTIIYTDKILINFPKTEIILKTRINNCLYDILEYSYKGLIDNNNKKDIIKNILTKLKMLDFYLKLSFDKGAISHKSIKTLGINLREITNLYYAWLNKNEAN